MRSRWSVTWNDREVENPFLRVVVSVVAIVLGLLGAIVGLLGLFLAIAVLAIVIPLSIPVHLILVKTGRKGFWEGNNYKVGAEGFRKV
jgi:hypothetical protein